MEKVDKQKEQMGDVSKEMETQRKNKKKEMLEIKNIVNKRVLHQD